jgi:hypothetical protein
MRLIYSFPNCEVAIMKRRNFVKNAVALQFFVMGNFRMMKLFEKSLTANIPAHRLRPGDKAWPSKALWDQLNRKVDGRLMKLESPFDPFKNLPDSKSCTDFFNMLKNPYYIGDHPALTQSYGWIDAWISSPSAYAVAASGSQDVVAAINFARNNNLRLVVKGGSHSYQGTSNSKDSLMVWTRAMNTKSFCTMPL